MKVESSKASATRALIKLAVEKMSQAEALPASDYLSLSRYLSFFLQF